MIVSDGLAGPFRKYLSSPRHDPDLKTLLPVLLTSTYYRFLCHHPLITQSSPVIQMGALCFDTRTLGKTCFWRFFDAFFDDFLFYVFQKDVDSARLYKWAHCALTQEPLQKPVVACELVCHKNTFMYIRMSTMKPKLFGIQIWWYQTFLST